VLEKLLFNKVLKHILCNFAFDVHWSSYPHCLLFASSYLCHRACPLTRKHHRQGMFGLLPQDSSILHAL